MKQRTRRLPRPRAGIAIVACGLAASMVSGAAGADDLFTAPWLGFDAGSSAYPGNPQPFERDPTALATADFNGDGYVDVAVANYEYSAPGGGTDGMSGFAVLFGGPGRRFSEHTHERALSQILAAARQLGISVYDASYLELAMRLGATLATRDARLSATAATAGVPLFDTA